MHHTLPESEREPNEKIKKMQRKKKNKTTKLIMIMYEVDFGEQTAAIQLHDTHCTVSETKERAYRL